MDWPGTQANAYFLEPFNQRAEKVDNFLPSPWLVQVAC